MSRTSLGEEIFLTAVLHSLLWESSELLSTGIAEEPKSWTQPNVNGVNRLGLTRLLYQPVLFKLNGSEVAQEGMKAIVHVDLIEEPVLATWDIRSENAA